MDESKRLEAFSDGVIAIAITLLVLDIHVPDVGHRGGLARALAHQWPSYAAYALTFVVIGIMWVNHHALFAQVVRVNRTLLLLNIMLLMGIGFLPFPTALTARYLRDGNNGRVATAIYSTTMVFIGLGFLILWWYLSRNPQLLRPEFGARGAQAALRRTVPGPALYAASIVVAVAAPVICLAVYAAMAAYFIFPQHPHNLMEPDDIESGPA
ncbi:MAG: hypothetical protein JWL83_3438 [Actinomycetia bacterium]|nr:hypothetical protein [Actinomycetes bacterium]